VIDLHSHVLPGIDDGAETPAQSLDMLRAAAEGGITQLAATPHVREDFPTTPDAMERLVADVNAAARSAEIPVEVLPGGELALSFASQFDDATLRRFGLGGNPSLLLLEVPYGGWPLSLRSIVFDLRLRGFTVVLAHPERNADVQSDRRLLQPLIDDGALVQLTAASLDGRIGRRAQATAGALLDERRAHLIASDAHIPEVRAIGLASAAERLGNPGLARWLTHDVPAALVAGTDPPPRP
jgi:protein-tyrosine phosphatase